MKKDVLKLIYTSAVSATFEIVNDNPYYIDSPYDVYLNDSIVLNKVKTNVFSLFNLIPNTNYKVAANNEVITFKTLSVTEIINVKDFRALGDGIKNDTVQIQEAINKAKAGSLIVIPEGTYYTGPLFLRNNITIELKKGACLLGDTNRYNYPILKGVTTKDNKELVIGSWEGEAKDNFASLITGISVENVSIVGEGTIDGNGNNSDWWINHKVLRGAWRPHDIFLYDSNNVVIQGLNVVNSPSWTIHPFYSNDLKFLDLNINAIKTSPNTDGCNPESSTNVLILGVVFNVGDDCIAIKSGKIDMVKKHYKPSSNIEIRNCFMGDGHGGVVFGSEISCGVNNVTVTNCLFNGTDRGLRIKTRRGRGETCVINNVVFNNILMKEVKNALVINMYYYCDSDGKSDYVQNKGYVSVDERTPCLKKFTFKNIKCLDTVVSAGYFYGLPEALIEEIHLENIMVTYKETDTFESPAMMNDCDKYNRLGYYFMNVKEVVTKNVSISGQIGEEYITNNCERFIKE